MQTNGSTKQTHILASTRHALENIHYLYNPFAANNVCSKINSPALGRVGTQLSRRQTVLNSERSNQTHSPAIVCSNAFETTEKLQR